MKIAVLTNYRGTNYGSILQAYALTAMIRGMGHDCEILAYQPTKKDNWRLKTQNRAWRETIVYKVNEGCKKVFCRRGEGTLQALADFQKTYMHISPVCATREQLRKAERQYDAFVCGSDQIWNPYAYDPVYFLDFVASPRRKMAYAPSLGVSQIPKRRRQEIAAAVREFDMLSVRERQGAALIAQLTGQQPQVTADPTLLMPRVQWTALARAGRRQQQDAPYLFCYFLGSDRRYRKHAGRIAQKFGLKIRMLPMTAADYARAEAVTAPVGPCEWLALVEGADFVLTDSFHCTVFSVIFGKSFYTLERFSPTDRREQNSRVHDFLSRAQLEDRILTKEAYEKLPPQRSAQAMAALQPWIDASKAWLGAQLKRMERGGRE